MSAKETSGIDLSGKQVSGRVSEEQATEAASLVEGLADRKRWFAAWQGLMELGMAALPATRSGLHHGDWHVRKWCAAFLDHHADPESLHDLIPLLHDPKSQVRLWAVHSLSCDRCKTDANPIDVVPHLIERIELDESIRVRRMAVAMLSTRPPDARLARLFATLIAKETDRKLRLHAERGLKRCREVGLASGGV